MSRKRFLSRSRHVRLAAGADVSAESRSEERRVERDGVRCVEWDERRRDGPYDVAEGGRIGAHVPFGVAGCVPSYVDRAGHGVDAGDSRHRLRMLVQ